MKIASMPTLKQFNHGPMNIEEQIYILQNDSALIIVYTEAPNTSIDQVNLYFDYLTEIAKNRKFHVILDLTKTSRPSAEIRSCLKNRFKRLEEDIISYHVIVGTNIFIKIAVKFIGSSIGLRFFKISNSKEAAQKEINAAN